MKIVHRIEEYIIKAFEEAQVKSVLVAVSGGADSVALLRACARIAPRLALRLEAANCNFHLRGAESDRDSAFSASLCEQLGIPLHRLDYDTSLYMERYPDLSTEMACRELRYADFFRILQTQGLERVAVAHNADDDIETMLLALLRGSGTRGLRGMDVDNGRVIRPLLGISRTEIEEYLYAIGQSYITDSSNLTSDYRRNFIRREVIPVLENRWSGAKKSLSRTLSIMKEESSIVEEHYRQLLSSLCPDPTTLLVYAEGITPGTIQRFLEPFGGNSSVAGEILGCLSKEFRERLWRLSERYDAVLERDRLIIIDHSVETHEPSLRWKIMEMTPELMTEIKNTRSHDLIYLPKDASAYELRRPMTGDRIAPLGMKGTRLVSDIISDAKLDRASKEQIRVLVRLSDGEIIWVTGLKRSRKELVQPSSIYAFKVVYKPRKDGIYILTT